jgi:uncharacterized protein YbjT (DUF2867 family)
MVSGNNRRILVVGGGTFLGDQIIAALLAEGAEVTALVRSGAEDRLGSLAQRIRWYHADVWNPPSLRGRARGHASVIHTVGSLTADPSTGLNFNWLNFISARNVANMCVSDGVSHMVLMSSVRAPWVSGQYIHAKREAENYIRRVGLTPTIIRAPLVYMRGMRRNLFFVLMTVFGSTPILSWLWFGKVAPMPVDMLARGVARITLDQQRAKMIYYAPDLRRRNTAREARQAAPATAAWSVPEQVKHPIELLGEDTPFGWIPDRQPDDE